MVLYHCSGEAQNNRRLKQTNLYFKLKHYCLKNHSSFLRHPALTISSKDEESGTQETGMHGVEKRCWQEGHKSSRGSQQAPTLSSVPQAAVLCFSTPRPTWDRKYAQQLPAFKAALALPIQHSVLLMEPKKQAANISALSSWSKRWERDSSVHF